METIHMAFFSAEIRMELRSVNRDAVTAVTAIRKTG